MTTRKATQNLQSLFYTVYHFEKEYVCLEYLFKKFNFDYTNMGEMLID